MKILYVIFILSFSSFLNAQSDSLAVDIVADTVIIKNYGVYENCCSSFYFSVQQENDTVLYITEIDTGQICRCGNCNFDLEVKITDLAAGNYIAQVYRDWVHLERPVVFIGEIRFSFQPAQNPQSIFKYSGTQGACYHVIADLENETVPDQFRLYNAYPNPFNPETTIEYELVANSQVNLTIYSVQGHKISTLVNKRQNAGKYKVIWDGSGLASGVYWYRLVTENGYSSTKKIVLLK